MRVGLETRERFDRILLRLRPHALLGQLEQVFTNLLANAADSGESRLMAKVSHPPVITVFEDKTSAKDVT